MNKLTKLLSVFLIAGVIGTGVAGVAGCKKDKDDDQTNIEQPGGDENKPGTGGNENNPTTHTHTYGEEGTDLGNGKHKLVCTGCDAGTEGHEKIEDHKDEDNNNKCDVCDAVIDTTLVTTVIIETAKNTHLSMGDELTLVAKTNSSDPAKQAVTWSIVSGGDAITLDTENAKVTAGRVTETATVTLKATANADSNVHEELTIYVDAITKYDDLATRGEGKTIFADKFETETTIAELPATDSFATKGMYYKNDDGGTGSVVWSNGKLVHAPGGSKNVSLMIVPGTDAVKDIVEFYGILNPDATGSKWPIFTLYDSAYASNTTFKGEMFNIVTDSNKKLAYRVGNGGELIEADEEVDLKSNTDYVVYVKYSPKTGLVTATVNDKVICQDVCIGPFNVDAIKLISSSSGDRKVTFDNIAVATSEYTLAEAKEAYKLVVDSLAEQMAVDEDEVMPLTLTGDVLTEGLTEIKAGIDETTDASTLSAEALAQSVYAKVVLQAKASACALIDGYRTTGDEAETFTGAQLEALEAARTEQKKTVNANTITSVSDVKTALQAAYTELDKCKNDTQAANIAVTLTLQGESGSLGEIDTYGDTELTVEELLAGITTPAFLTDYKFYTDEGHTTEITAAAPFTTNKTDAAQTVYVVASAIDPKGTTTVTVADKTPTVADGSTGEIVVSNDDAMSFDASNYKFGSDANQLIVTVKVRAGQKVTVTLSVWSGSSTKVVALAHSSNSENFTSTSPNYNTSNTDSKNPDTYTVEYTASADGEYVITIVRTKGTKTDGTLESGAGGVKVKQVVVTIADPTPAA